jgi:hypothetical protein
MRVKVHHQRADQKNKPKRQRKFESIGIAETPYNDEEKKSVKKCFVG